jgi:hypothetical protein
METIKPCAEHFKKLLKTSTIFVSAINYRAELLKGNQGEDAIQTVEPEDFSR